MKKVFAKYFLLLLAILQVGVAQLRAENVESYILLNESGGAEYVDLSSAPEDGFSIASVFSTSPEKWQIIINEVEEETETESSKTCDSFISFYNSEISSPYILSKIPTYNYCFSFVSLYLKFQVFRL